MKEKVCLNLVCHICESCCGKSNSDYLKLKAENKILREENATFLAMLDAESFSKGIINYKEKEE